MAMDDITKAVYAEGNIDLTLLPKEFKPTGALDHPQMGGRVHEITVDGKTFSIPTTIAHDNKDKFRYSWLDLETKGLPMYKGYAFVTKDSPAAKNEQGDKIPDSYFGGHNVIRSGTMVYCYCLESYGKTFKEAGQNYALERLGSFQDEESSVNITDGGARMGGVVTQSHTTESVGDSNNNLPIGRGKKG